MDMTRPLGVDGSLLGRRSGSTATGKELGHRLDRGLLGPSDFHLPCGWGLLLATENDTRCRVTLELLKSIEEVPAHEFGPVVFRHRSRPGPLQKNSRR
jgi:hypothetical protein